MPGEYKKVDYNKYFYRNKDMYGCYKSKSKSKSRKKKRIALSQDYAAGDGYMRLPPKATKTVTPFRLQKNRNLVEDKSTSSADLPDVKNVEWRPKIKSQRTLRYHLRGMEKPKPSSDGSGGSSSSSHSSKRNIVDDAAEERRKIDKKDREDRYKPDAGAKIWGRSVRWTYFYYDRDRISPAEWQNLERKVRDKLESDTPLIRDIPKRRETRKTQPYNPREYDQLLNAIFDEERPAVANDPAERHDRLKAASDSTGCQLMLWETK